MRHAQREARHVKLLGSALSPYATRVMIAARRKGVELPVEAPERIDLALGYLDHFRIDGEFASGDAFSAADCALIRSSTPSKACKMGGRRSTWCGSARGSPRGGRARASRSSGCSRALRLIARSRC
jgi:hypothetical protein